MGFIYHEKKFVCFVENLSSSSLMRRPSKLKSFEFEVKSTQPHVYPTSRSKKSVSLRKMFVRVCDVRTAMLKRNIVSLLRNLYLIFSALLVFLFVLIIWSSSQQCIRNEVWTRRSFNSGKWLSFFICIKIWLIETIGENARRLRCSEWQLLVKTVKIVHKIYSRV